MACHQLNRTAILIVSAFLLPACGRGSSDNAPPSVVPPDPQVVITDPVGVQAGHVSIQYNLIDAQSEPTNITVEFSVNGGIFFSPATGGVGGDGTSLLATSPSPGTVHTYSWNSLLDGVGTGLEESDVQIRISPFNPVQGEADTTLNFAVNNTGNSPPSASISMTQFTSGLVVVSYSLADPESNVCNITVEWSDGGPYTTCADGPGGDLRNGLAAAPGSTAHTYIWNSYADVPGFASVNLRITPTDGETGTASTPFLISINNTGLSDGQSIGGGFPVTHDPSTGDDVITSVASDGRYLYIVGSYYSGATDLDDWYIEKRDLRDGTLVTAFDGDGVLTSSPTAGIDKARGIAIDSTCMYVVGYQEVPPFGNSVLRIRIEKRLLTTGALVNDFDGDGIVLGSTGLSAVEGVNVAIDSTSLYVLSLQDVSATDSQLLIEKRSLLDGSLIAGFGINGVLTHNVNGLIDGAVEGVVQGSMLYLVGVQDLDFAAIDSKRRIEKRSVITGALDPNFGSGGAIVTNPGAGLDLATHVAAGSDGLYVLSVRETGYGTDILNYTVEKRSLTTGAVIATQTSTASNTFMIAAESHLLLDGASVYLCLVHNNGGDADWRIEKRLASDLTLDATFGTGGIVDISPTTGEDVPNRMAVAGGVLYIGGTADILGQAWRIEAIWK